MCDEGVVAIVQGLKDAGLAVTMMDRRLLRNRNSYRRPLVTKSSVETNTDNCYREYFNINRGTSVRDGHYASSYQIAHCIARPISPPQGSLEFPPQRFKPSRTEGNFEVGSNYGVWDTFASPSYCYRGMGWSDKSIERGSMYANRSERPSHETFAHSLRRYPAFSPERSISSELVQKLLSYTQNKYLSKSTSKSQRSLNRDKSHRGSKFEVKPSKNIQTYTRAKRDVLTRDCGANTSHDLKFATKRWRSFSTLKDNRYCKDEINNTTYDYLDSPVTSRHSRRTNEVRYFNDVKKYIRDTIRQMYDDKPLACPRIRRRYSHHRKQHHTGENEQNSSQSIEVQASIPSTSKATTFTHCEPPPGSHSYVPTHVSVSTSNIICCNCNKPRPCICEQKAEKTATAVKKHITDWVDELPIFTENTRPNKREKDQVIKELSDIICKIPKDENYDDNVRKEIKSYIESLPMWHPGTKEDDYEYKDEVVDNLIDRLQTLDDETADAVKDLVRKLLDDIQFDKNIDMDKTVNNFAAHLTPFINDVDELKTKLNELLKNLPITNKNNVINDIQDDFANDLTALSTRSTAPVLTEQELENEINEFLDAHPDILDQGDKVKNLARKLKNTQSKPISEDVKEEKMKDNVVDWIDTLPKNTRDKFTLMKKEEFSNDLVDKVKNARKDKTSSLQTQNEIENEIWGILESMDVDRNYVDESIVKGYALNLKEIEKSNIDDEDVANETIDFINELEKSGIQMKSRDQDRFQEKVLGKLKRIQAKDRQSRGGRRSSFVTSTPNKGRFSSIKDFDLSSLGEVDEASSIAGPSGLKDAEKQYNNKLNDEIESWIDTLPINFDREKQHKKVMIDDLASDIMDRQKYLQIHPNAAKSNAEELEHLKYQVFRWLNKMDGIKDHEMAPVMDKTKNLMDKIKKVDVPLFNKSSLRSASRNKSFGLPSRKKEFESPNKEKRFGLPTREQSYGSATDENSFRSPTGEQSFGNETYIPTQNSSAFIKENLDGAITDWIKQLPLYEKATPEQKRRFEEVVPGISKGIKRVYDAIDNLEQDIDMLVIDQIEKQMKDFPLSSEDKRDDKFITRAAAQLLQYLKDQQMFQDISERKDVPYDEYLKQHVDDWAYSFSLTHLSPLEKMQFEDLKYEFTLKLKQARDDGANKDELKSEINEYLKKLPLKDSVRSNKEYQDRKIEELLKTLSILPAATASRIIPDIPQFVRKAVAEWILKLPLDKGKTLTDIPKDAVKNMEKTISDALTHRDEIPSKRIKRSIERATVRFLDEVPLHPKKTYDTKALANDLLENIKDIPKDAKKVTPTSYGLESSKEYSRDYENVSTNELKDVGDNLSGAILDWMKQQPLYSDKKGELDKLAPDLSKNLKSILKNSKGKDQDQVLIDEMTKHFKDTPLESKDSAEAVQLLQYLKDLKMLQDSSKTSTDIQEIDKIVDDFSNNNVDLKKGTWSDKNKFRKLKSELVTKLKECLDNKVDQDALKKEVKYYINRFPLSEDERKDDRFIEKKAEELIESLLTNKFPDVYNYVRKGVVKWMKSLPLDKGKNINDIPKQAIDQIMKSLSDQFIHAETIQIGDTRKIIEEETNKFLKKTPLDRNKPRDAKKLAADLFDFIKESSKDKRKVPSEAKINKISSSASAEDPEPTSSKAYISKSAEDPLSTVAKISIPTSTETLLSNESGSMHPSLKSAADQLADNVEQWVNNLPIKEDTPEEKNKANDFRRRLSSRIMSKVSELNTNPEIFKDDFLYEEMFGDEVDGIVTGLSNEDLRNKIPLHKKSLVEIVKDARRKTQEEMAGSVYKEQLREVVSKTVPSESLSENENASFEVLKEDVADAFVSLHYNRGVKGDAETKTQFKNNVKREIDVFCAEYLKNHPNAAVNVEKLNNDLYNALKDIPVPKDETMRQEIEIIKIKELVYQWIDEDKLFGNQTGVNRLKTKKKITVLAKKVHDIEKLKENNPDLDSDDMLKKEIKKWLQKMPLAVEDDLDKLTEQLVNKLKRTKDAKKSLTSDSFGKESTMPASSYSTRTWSSPIYSSSPKGSPSHARLSSSPRPTISIKVLRRSVVSPTSRTPICKPTAADISSGPEVSGPTTAETPTAPEFTIVPSPCAPPCAIPPSTLSPEDREYLRKIRERATQSTQSSPKSSKDAAVSPIPVDYGSLTEITADITNKTPQAQSSPRQAQTSSSQTSEAVETSKPGMQTTGSQAEVVPHIIVKEYYWDSVNSKMSPCSKICPPTPLQPCPRISEATCIQRPCYPCPPRSSQQAQTVSPCPEECDPECRDYPYFLPNLPPLCSSKPRRSRQSYHNVGPKRKRSNINLAWSKEDFYGERREPADEEEIIIDMGRRNKSSCRCKDRVTVKSNGVKRRDCKSCKIPSESLRKCPKCCGVHCPYPSYFYFTPP